MRKKPSSIHVTRTDSSRITLTQPVLKNDSLAGFSEERRGRYYRNIALTDISKVEIDRSNVGAVVVLVVVAAGAFALLVGGSKYCPFNCENQH
jgi:hypothetical protein